MILADTSAWTWARKPGLGHLRAKLDGYITGGALATCDPVRLELLQSTRNVEEFRAWRTALEALPDLPIGPEQWHRGLDVYELLAAQGGAHHRSVKHPDLLVAAAAEVAGIPVLHYDADFDRIAEVTGQPTRWLAPRGSIG